MEMQVTHWRLCSNMPPTEVDAEYLSGKIFGAAAWEIYEHVFTTKIILIWRSIFKYAKTMTNWLIAQEIGYFLLLALKLTGS